ncbi:MAG TPA: serine/threonine-protein kinase [Kofleriaceae bacterium]|nr:serine/threonine-protein kinase [Kofleriaceae bacterium]
MGSAVGSLIPPGARSFGKYELLARLAVGGMAEIFLARRRGAGGKSGLVVIKRVLPHLAEDARFVAMFRDEARLASRIEHVNACRVLELGSVGDTYFIAMEYLHGVPLSRVLLRSARTSDQLGIRFIAGVIQQSCAGLHHAHELSAPDGRLLDVVHRDVSPPNIFVTAEGQVKLLDFGVAKARGASQKTRTGTVKGKNAYMSPEQVLGEPIDRRSDLFSLGIVMWESLTASRLFLRDTDFETFRSITKGEIPDVRELRPDIPLPLAEVVRRALERDRDRRYATAEDLGSAVAAALESMNGPAGADEIARYVHAHFSKELAAKQDLLEAAAAPDGARLARLPPDALDLLGTDGEPGSGPGDDEVTSARPGPPRAAVDLGDIDGVVARPAARRDAVTIPMQAGVARLGSAPAAEDEPPEPPGAAAAPPETEPVPVPVPPPEPVPPPIEPARTEAIRRPARWRMAPPWLPGLALLFAGACGLAALLYYFLTQ